MRQRFVKIMALSSIVMCLSACGMTHSQRNTTIGAAIGGVTSNLLFGGVGATLGGAALGGVIGSQVK